MVKLRELGFAPVFLALIGVWISAHAERTPVPIKAASVSATKTAAGYTVNGAFDGNVATIWHSGAVAPQAVYADLGGLMDVTIKVTVAQSPAGQTRHLLSAGATVNSLIPQQEIAKYTADGNVLTFGPFYGIGAFSLTTLSSPSQVAWREIQIIGKLADCSAIKRFGYFGSSLNSVNPSGDVGALGRYSNIAWVESEAANTADLINRIKLTKAAGMKSIVGVRTYLFESALALRPDYASWWAGLASALKPYEADIEAFYPYDEPYLNAFYKGGANAVYNMRTMLDTVGPLIKSSFPTKPIAVIFGSGEFYKWYIGADLYIPKSFDWLGFDCYGPFSNCDGSGTSVNDLMATLNAMRTGTQRLFVVPTSFAYAKENTVENQVVIAKRAREYFLLAKQYGSVMEGFFPFIYHSVPGTDIIGTQSLSIVSKDMQRYGACISRKGVTPPAPAPTPVPTAVPTAAPQPTAVPVPQPTIVPGTALIHRFYQASPPDLYYTRKSTAPAGYAWQGSHFALYPAPTGSCVIPLSLCKAGTGRHYVGSGCGNDSFKEFLGYSCGKNDDGKMRNLSFYMNMTTRSSFTGPVKSDGYLVETSAYNYITSQGMAWKWVLGYAH